MVRRQLKQNTNIYQHITTTRKKDIKKPRFQTLVSA